ncbi:MAG TPA: peptidase U32 [Candidatus Omnitrophica bacterium]|nr:peptidase U32 [Candidatus Omnitrophota bacterium]
MKYAVCTNFADDLIPRLENKKDILYIYGKLTSDFVGGGRASYMMPLVNKRKVAQHVAQAHKDGLKFNYLLNSACMGNNEFTIAGQRQIRRLLDWIESIGVDSVTVAIPYLARMIKKHHPRLGINVSTFDYVDTVVKARAWEDLGVDGIVLPNTLLNRDFEALRKFRKHLKCKIQLLANNACLFGCHCVGYHKVIMSHGSQSSDISGGYVLDYCALSCRYQRFVDPVNFIRSDWIRPEDVGHYEDLGIDALKIIGRARNTDFIVKAYDAYSKRSYDGNLLDIVAHPYGEKRKRTAHTVLRGLLYAARFHLRNPFYLKKMIKSFPDFEVYLDNKKLDGFLDYFVNGHCQKDPCDGCSWCAQAADKALKIDETYRQGFLNVYKKVLDELAEGKPFKYF